MPDSRPFMDFLREHRNGATHDELSDQLNELVAAVGTERKAGSLTLKISIKPGNVGEGSVMVADEIKLVAPKPTKSSSMFFITPENNLIREDPRQKKLDLREVSPGVPASAARALS